MAVKSNRINTSVSFAFANIAENNLEVKTGDLLSFTAEGFVTKATPDSLVIGISNDKKSFPENNETVEQWRVDYNPVIRENTYKMAVAGGDTSSLIVGHFYTMNDSQELDPTTDSPSVGQFMVQDIYANSADVRFVTNVGLAIPQYEDVRLAAIYPTNPESSPFDGQYTFELSNGTIVAGDFSDLAWYLGDVTITGNLTTTGNITAEGNVSIDGNLDIAGTTNTEDINVGGVAIFDDTVTANGDTTIDANLSVTGSTTLSGDLSVAGTTQFASDVTFLGTGDFVGDLTAESNLNVGVDLNVAGNSAVTGNESIAGELSVTGNTTLNGSNTFTGATQFNSSVDMDEDLNVDGTVHVGGSETIDHVLTVNESLVLGPNATAAQFILQSEKDQAGGVAALDANGHISNSVIPPLAIGETFVVSSEAAMLALTAQRGDICVRTDITKTFIKLTDTNPSTLADWQQILSSGEVISVNGQTGAVALDADDIPDLGCTNQWTNDTEKAYWNGKEDAIGYVTENSANRDITTLVNSTAHYPSSSLMKTLLDGKEDTLGYTPEDTANKDTAVLVDSTDHYPSSHVLHDQLLLKQDKLVSGANIKTINGLSILGAGNIVIQGGGGGSSAYGHYEQTLAGVATHMLSNTPVSSESFMVFSDSGTAMFPIIDYTYDNNSQTITFNSLGANETAIIRVLSAS